YPQQGYPQQGYPQQQPYAQQPYAQQPYAQQPYAPPISTARPAAGAPAPRPAAGAAPGGGGAGADNAHDLRPGFIIPGRYRVEPLIGRGGMGAVYAVQHVNTGETLALKVLHPVLAGNRQAVDRFRTEARAPVRIGTDHVVRIFDADVSPELGDVPFMVME